ncbi:MAG: serine hydrolase [Desulfuromusa sp.]|nr:serine hydrolase [Desulfuromusa sp.]
MKVIKLFSSLLIVLVMLVSAMLAFGYPLDGYEETGIRRVEGARLANEGLAIGGFQPPGAMLTTEQVDLRLLNEDMALPAADPAFTAQVTALLGEHAADYGITVLDLTDLENPRYAEHRGDYRQNVGSVGKLLVALGYFQALADTWPNDLDRRKAILRDTIMTADDFSHSDHHTIRLFDVETRKLTRRPLADGDQGSVWEYLDWMLSVSSNSAAAMVMRDAMLLKHFGQSYPVSEEEIKTFFSTTPGSELTKLFQQTFWQPVTRNGLSLDQIRQGSFFTRQGKKNVNGGGNSYATARSLMDFLLKMEEGVLVDEWSSRQLKRLLYMTERRIRYASSPELKEAAVYFKSGSWYKCKEEEGFKCGKYAGNVINYMNSVAIVEQEVDGVKLQYMVIVISNVLRQNSAVEHQTLGTEIHRMIKKDHAVTSP